MQFRSAEYYLETKFMRLKFIILTIIILYFAYDVVIDLFTDDEFEIDILIETLMFTAATVLLILEIRRTQRMTVAFEEVQQHNRLLSSQLSDLIEVKFNDFLQELQSIQFVGRTIFRIDF